MRCDEARERLTPYVDDELDPVASRELEEHVSGCAECARALAQARELKAALRRELPYHRAPGALRARIEAQVREAAGAGRVVGSVRPARARALPAWLAAAAVVLVVAGGAWTVTALRARDASGALAEQVVASHVRSLMPGHLTDVTSTDQHTVKPWFDGRLDFAPPVVDLADRGFPLLGGRLDYLDGRPVAALVYGRRKHLINVFLWPAPGARDHDAPPLTRRGYHLLHGTRGGMAYWIASDLAPKELEEFRQLDR